VFGLRVASVEAIRALAPVEVTVAATLDFRTLMPERGGLFDHRVFGPGTVIDAVIGDDTPYKKARTQFGRLELGQAYAHPLVADATIEALPILPPDLRPLERLVDDRWKSSGINELYRRLVMMKTGDRSDLLRQLADELVASCGGASAIEAGLATTRGSEPATGREYRLVSSLRALCFEL